MLPEKNDLLEILNDILICSKCGNGIYKRISLHQTTCESYLLNAKRYSCALVVNTTNTDIIKLRRSVKYGRDLFIKKKRIKYGELFTMSHNYQFLFLYYKDNEIKIGRNLLDVYDDKTHEFNARFKRIYNRLKLLDNHSGIGLYISNSLILANPTKNKIDISRFFQQIKCKKTNKTMALFKDISDKLGFSSTHFDINIGSASLSSYVV